MTSDKLIARKVDALPARLRHSLSAHAKSQGFGHIPSCIAISFDNRYVTDENGKPLLFIWAHRNTFLSTNLELCMITTEHFKARHAREAKRLIWDWVKEQTRPIYARCNTQTTQRFLDFMGFVKVEESDGTINYKAVK